MRVTAVVSETGGHPAVTHIEVPSSERELAMHFIDFAHALAVDTLGIDSDKNNQQLPKLSNSPMAIRAVTAAMVCNAFASMHEEEGLAKPLVLTGKLAEEVYPQLMIGMHEVAAERANEFLIGKRWVYRRHLSKFLGLIENQTLQAEDC